jgi:AraC family transcriptional regulator
MNQVADYIEEHLDDEMNYAQLADIVCCTVYQFGRVFSYVVGISLSEYVRRRRLSQAALELQDGNKKVIDIALKYGYSSPDAFTRAFVAMHGVTPKEACTLGAKLKLYPRITFHISIIGDTDMEYRIEKKGIVHCAGIVRNFGKLTVNQSASHWTEETPKIWEYWDNFLNRGENIVIRDKYKLYRPPFYQVGFNQTLENGDTVVSIGAEAKPGETYPELMSFEIPEHTWAVFPVKGTLNQNVHPISKTMTRVLNEWLPSSGYELIKGMDLETYGPGDTQSDDYVCELWLPVRKK